MTRASVPSRRRKAAKRGEVGDPAHDEDEIHRPGAEDLVGDVDVAAEGVMGLGHRRRGGCGRRSRRVARDEDIAAPGAGLDVLRGLGRIAQRAADVGDLD